MKIKFIHILGLSAAILTGTAAYISVTGLSKLFVGAFYSMIVMIGGLELAKLVIASYLYRYWSEINKIFKIYLMIGVIVIMLITSAGIYGFLSSAYSVTAGKMIQIDRQIEFFERKKSIIQEQVGRVKSIIDNKSSRINMLTTIRTNQETRIDTLYRKNYIASVRKTEAIIKDANNEIGRLNHQIDSLGGGAQTLLDSISKIDLKILEYKNNDVNSEIGPLKYIAILTGKSIDDVVNFFILLLIFVFDPLAVCLVIATNKVLLSDKVITKKDSWFYKTTYKKQRE